MQFGVSSNTTETTRFGFFTRRLPQLLFFSFFLSLAAFLLHLPSNSGVSLAIPPDSTEYAIGLANLFDHGKFGFTLNGEWYPSRYAPWFSLFCLSPAYLVFNDVLALHWAILAFALSFLVISYKFGRLVGLGNWAYACAILPLFIPDFVFYSRMVMTEIPYTAIFAASAIVFVRFVMRETLSVGLCLGAGVLVAWGGSVRVTALPMVVLFVIAVLVRKCNRKQKLIAIMALMLPTVLYVIANVLYNKLVFGSYFRNGYQYWVPVPCDYSNLSFNLSYLWVNARKYLQEPVTLITLCFVVFISAVGGLMVRGRLGGGSRNKSFLLLFGYVAFQGCVLFALYIGYYWCDVRFFLPVLFCLIPLFVKAAVALLGGGNKMREGTIVIAIVLLCAGDFRFVCPRYFPMAVGYPFRIVEAGITREVVPSESIIIQSGNPALIDFFGHKEKSIKHIPIYRSFDYVTAMIAPVPIAEREPKPRSYRQRFIPELVEAGVCKLPFPETFLENPERIKQFLQEGKRVFLHRGLASDSVEEEGLAARKLKEGFNIKKLGKWSIPALEANPVRHIYDEFIFPLLPMDSRPEIWCAYYEVLAKE